MQNCLRVTKLKSSSIKVLFSIIVKSFIPILLKTNVFLHQDAFITMLIQQNIWKHVDILLQTFSLSDWIITLSLNQFIWNPALTCCHEPSLQKRAQRWKNNHVWFNCDWPVRTLWLIIQILCTVIHCTLTQSLCLTSSWTL